MLRADGRSAFTLAEVIVALTVTCIVAALISTMLVREQRTHVGLASLTELRAQLRQGAEILASELRNISVADGDIVTFSTNPPVLEMIAQRGVGVVCAVTAPNVVALPPSDPREGKERLAWLARNPSGGMALQLLNDAGTVEQADDSWHTIEIESASTAAGGCASSEFAGAAAATGTAQAIRLRDSLPAAITAGTAWRLVERVRYSVYKSGGDWFLGYCASNSISIPCGSPQPVAGPFIAPNKDSADR